MEAPAEFVVLSGFLGSGKTTLLGDLLAADDDGRTAVIVNDVGQVNIDGALIAVTAGVPMATLSNGCVCCSLTNDLQYTIEAMLETRRLSGAAGFRRIILECSGLSDPSSVLRSLSELAHLHMRVRVVTTYACDRPMADQEEFGLAAAQLAAAHVIVLTRMDVADSEQIGQATALVRALGPMAALVAERDRHVRAQRAFDEAEVGEATLPRSPAAFLAEGTVGHPRINVYALQWNGPVAWPLLAAWLENLAGYLEARLLRVKGLVVVEGCEELLLIQGVGQHFDTPRRIRADDPSTGSMGGRRSNLIIIARDTELTEIRDIGPALSMPCRLSMIRSPGAGSAPVRLARLQE